MRRKVIAGNWKLNGSASFIDEFVQQLVPKVRPRSIEVDIVIAPPSILIPVLNSALQDTTIKVSGQNVAAYEKGAYTGEVAASQLKEAGCELCIVGHSERRAIFGETDDVILEKVRRLLAEGLEPILCLGETLEEREAGDTLTVVLGQLDAVTSGLNQEELSKLMLAYEPVWAIGTGKTASPEQAQEVHAAIRARLAEIDKEVSQSMPILYGGSVNAANAELLFQQQDIDGGLVGGASLKADEFAQICSAMG